MLGSLTSSDLNVVLRKGYKFEGLLGEGAYAKVYTVASIRPDKANIRLACKFINQAEVPQEFVRKFLPRELNILLKLKHPNIIHVHSIFMRNNKCFIFMRMAEAGDALAYLIRMGELSEKHAKLWFHQLAQAVCYLHVMDIVHRDIKLENVFLSINMNVKLGDFGFARSSVNDEGESVLSETFCGSQQYAAPEVIKGIPYNPKLSDVWSLGCVLFAMLNKKLPFDLTDTGRLYELQSTHRYKYRDAVLMAISVEVKTLIFHMLEPNVNLRYDIDAVVKSEWLREMPLTEAQAIALSAAQAEKKIKHRKSMIDLVSTLQKGDVKHLVMLKEESAEFFKSQVYFAENFMLGDDQRQRSSKGETKRNTARPEEKKNVRNDNRGGGGGGGGYEQRRMTRPFVFADTKK